MNAAVAAIQFALKINDGLMFLQLWNEGEFDAVRNEWPDCPREVFEGAEVIPNIVYSFKCQAYSVKCPHCNFELLGLMGDPSGKVIECDECTKSFSVSDGATADIF